MSIMLSPFIRWFEQKTFHKKKIYILPTKSGMKYLFLNFLLFLIALSFANNMALIITFVMVSFFIIQMLETHKIIQDIEFDSLEISDQYSDKISNVHCHYKNDNLLLSSIQLELHCQERKIKTELTPPVHIKKNLQPNSPPDLY